MRDLSTNLLPGRTLEGPPKRTFAQPPKRLGEYAAMLAHSCDNPTRNLSRGLDRFVWHSVEMHTRCLAKVTLEHWQIMHWETEAKGYHL